MGEQSWRNSLQLRRHPRAKHVRIKVRYPGVVEVVAPPQFRASELPSILQQHTPWIEQKLSEMPADMEIGMPQQIALPAIDEQWQVDYRSVQDNRTRCREEREGGVLAVYADEPKTQRERLKRWLAKKGKQHLPPWLQQTSEELGMPYSGVSIRGQRTRWGSCSTSGRINLNYALLFLEPDLVRYLFVHELCHTKHHNHSRDYWALVSTIEPHYKVLEGALKAAAREIPAWLHAPFAENA